MGEGGVWRVEGVGQADVGVEAGVRAPDCVGGTAFSGRGVARCVMDIGLEGGRRASEGVWAATLSTLTVPPPPPPIPSQERAPSIKLISGGVHAPQDMAGPLGWA